MLQLAGILNFVSMIEQALPLAHAAVQIVEANAPDTMKGAQKFDAALHFVNSAIQAAPAAQAEVAALKTAAASGSSDTLTNAIGHAIEMSLSACKLFGFFDKAAIVKNAPDFQFPKTPDSLG